MFGFFKKIKKGAALQDHQDHNVSCFSEKQECFPCIATKTSFFQKLKKDSFKNSKTGKVGAKQRIGPHEEEVLSTLVGSLLGDGYAEKRSNATRIHIHMSSRNVAYIHFLHRFFSEKGYCSNQKPKLSKQIKKQNKVYFSCRFRTFSYSSLNYLYDLFYTKQGKKRVPLEIYNFLSPKALAIWIMDDGGKSKAGIKISTESFCLEGVSRLQKAIFEKYGIHCTIQRHKKKYLLYFPKSSLKTLSEVVKPFMIPDMYYKLNGY